MERRIPVIFVMGPTAAGKSDLALALARLFEGEIISVDSAQVYRGMDIGTAKADRALRDQIRHHLIDIRDPTEPYSAADFRTDALGVVADVHERRRLPILAGGTGLYFRALTRGLSELPESDPKIRATLIDEAVTHGWQRLHQRLEKTDPAAAARIHPNDSQRVQRALEVFELTGKPISLLQSAAGHSPDWRILKLIVAPRRRSELNGAIEARFDAMLRAGFIDEVRSLYECGNLHPGLPSVRAVGYRQAWNYLAGEITRTEMVRQTLSATRQLAKRQLTWLQRASDALWLFEASDSRAMRARRVVDLFLRGRKAA